MSLIETIEKDYKEAFKAKNSEKVGVLRMVKAAFGNLAIEKKKNQLNDEEALQVIQKQAKQRKESIASFNQANRKDLVEKEEKELAILQAYLPAQMSDDEIKVLAQKAIQESGAKTKADMGLVMKALMPHVKGRADGKQVQSVVQSLLA